MIDYNLLAIQNSWWRSRELIKQDPKIKEFEASTVKYFPEDILKLKLKKGAVNIVFGPRQTGKSTAIKLLIKDLIKKDTVVENIFYFNCDALNSRREIIDLVLVYIESIKTDKNKIPLNYIFLDEISSVKDWPFSIKWLVDAGILSNSKIILTGSSSINLKKSGEFLPGRRHGGKDIEFLPVNFAQFSQLLYPESKLPDKVSTFNQIKKLQVQFIRQGINLEQVYKEFLVSGGFLKMIDLKVKNESFSSTIELYKSTLRSELAKFGKKEVHSRQILNKIIASLTAETSYTNIAEEAELGSKNTAIDYLNFFRDSFLLNEVLFYSIPQKRIIIKKNKKYYPSDPFLLWIFQAFISGTSQIEPFYQKYFSSPLDSQLAEVFVASELYKKGSELYFYRDGRELDFYLPKKKLGIEVKYKAKITSSDMEGLRRSRKKILVSKNTLEQRKDILIVPVYLFGFIEY